MFAGQLKEGGRDSGVIEVHRYIGRRRKKEWERISRKCIVTIYILAGCIAQFST